MVRIVIQPQARSAACVSLLCSSSFLYPVLHCNVLYCVVIGRARPSIIRDFLSNYSMLRHVVLQNLPTLIRRQTQFLYMYHWHISLFSLVHILFAAKCLIFAALNRPVSGSVHRPEPQCWGFRSLVLAMVWNVQHILLLFGVERL